MHPFLCLGILILILILCFTLRNQDHFNNLTYKPGYLPSRTPGPLFEGMPPSLRVENDYHSCILQEGGDYGDYKLKQKCYLKALKNGTTDKADLICGNIDNEDDYYECLDGVYGKRLWADRFVGLKPCYCPGTTGTSTSTDKCFCPSPRPLTDRRMVNEYDQPL